MIIIGLFGVIGFALLALPASLATRFLPPQVQAEDFSGTLWHGSAGRLTAFGHNAGTHARNSIRFDPPGDSLGKYYE